MFDDREGGVPQDPKNTKKKALRKRALLNSGLLLKYIRDNYRFIDSLSHLVSVLP
jgi:hypothetical protein